MANNLRDFEYILANIDAQIDPRRVELAALEQEREELFTEHSMVVYKVKVGSIVVSKRPLGQNTVSVKYQVTKVDSQWGFQKPWISGYEIQKDGTYGIVIRNLYTHWSLLE